MNVEIQTQQPRSKVPALIWDSDVCLVLLKKSEVFKTVIPTKMLEFMACGRPVVLGVEGQALEIVNEAGAGIGIPPDDAEALSSAVLQLKNDVSLCETYGKNGATYIRERMSLKSTALDYEHVMFVVLGRSMEVPVDTLKKAADAS